RAHEAEVELVAVQAAEPDRAVGARRDRERGVVIRLVAEAVAPHRASARIELGDPAVLVAHGLHRIAAEVDGGLEPAGGDHVAGAIDGDRLSEIRTLAAV